MAEARFNGPFFHVNLGLAGFVDDGSAGDNWSCKSCKAPVKLSPPTNQHPTFYRSDALPVAQPTVQNMDFESESALSEIGIRYIARLA